MKLSDYIKLAWSSLWERKGRTIGAIIGLIIAILAFGTALGISEGFKHYFIEYFAKIFGVKSIYVIPLGMKITDVDLALISSLPYVDTVIPIVFTRGYTIVQGNPKYIYVIGVDPNKLPRLLGATSPKDTILKGTYTLSKGMVLVGYYIAYTETGKEILTPGQKIVVFAEGKSERFTIAGILTPFHPMVYGNPNVAIFMDFDTYFKTFSFSREYKLVIVQVKKVKYIDKTVKILRSLFPRAEVFELRSVIKSFTHFFTGFEIFTGIISGISLLIVSLWIFDTMTISVIQRTREFGILKSIGFTNKQIFLLLILEVIILTLVGELIGFTLLYMLKNVIVVTLPGGFVSIKPYLTIFNSLIVFLVPLFANIIATIIPAYKATKITPSQALRFE